VLENRFQALLLFSVNYFSRRRQLEFPSPRGVLGRMLKNH
jgi:hypothetical protein